MQTSHKCVQATLSWRVKRASFGRAVDIWMWPVASLIDQWTIRVRDIFHFEKWLSQLAHWKEGEREIEQNSRHCIILSRNTHLLDALPFLHIYSIFLYIILLCTFGNWGFLGSLLLLWQWFEFPQLL